MATVREYFDIDFSGPGQWFTDIILGTPPDSVTSKLRVHWDFDSGAKFITCFVPEVADPLSYLVAMLRDYPKYLDRSKGVVMSSVIREGHMFSSNELCFTRRFVMYYEGEMSQDIEDKIYKEAAAQSLLFELRTLSWAIQRHSFEKPLAFICHDSRDKDQIARPLAIELAKLACPAWFDEFTLEIGDSLRERIESGLKESHKCVFIITPNFLSNERWTKREFDSIFTREVLKNEKVVLPIWHEVNAEQVYEYSPSLADRVARQWSEGCEAVAHKIRRAILAA